MARDDTALRSAKPRSGDRGGGTRSFRRWHDRAPKLTPAAHPAPGGGPGGFPRGGGPSGGPPSGGGRRGPPGGPAPGGGGGGGRRSGGRPAPGGSRPEGLVGCVDALVVAGFVAGGDLPSPVASR